MQLNRFSFNQNRLECLNAQPVQCRRPVQQHRMLTNHFFENIPDFRPLFLDHPLRSLNGGRHSVEFELRVDERLEELKRHLLRQATLMQQQFRSNDNHRTTGIIDTLTEQVLTEPALLAFQHIAQRLQRPFVGTGNNASAAAVVEQRVDGLLKHAFLVPYDNVRSAQLNQALQTIVAVDHTTIEVVQVGRREATAIERYQGTQLRRNHRNNLQYHPLGTGSGMDESLDDLQPLDQLLALRFRIGLFQLDADIIPLRLEVDRLQHIL